MLRPSRMSRLFVLGAKSRLDHITKRLQELKIAHIIEHRKGEYGLCDPLKTSDRYSSLLVKTRSIISYLKVLPGKIHKRDIDDEILEDTLDKIQKQVLDALAVLKKNSDQEQQAKLILNILDVMEDLKVTPGDFRKLERITSWIGEVDSGFEHHLRKITTDYLIRTAPSKQRIRIALFADRDRKDEIEHVLLRCNFSAFDVEAARGMEGSIRLLRKQEEAKISVAQTQMVKSDRVLEQLRTRHGSLLVAIEEYLEKKSAQAQIPLSFGATEETFFLECYVPTDRVKRLKWELDLVAEGKIHFKEKKLTKDEEVPVELNNPKGLKSFEFFTRLYSLPKYDEFDPTLLMAFTFPLFFGFMLGDVAYGLITFIIFFMLRQKFPAGRQFFNILITSSVASMIFGALYGEVLGYELWHGLIVRTHDVMILMEIALVAGAIQVNLGLLIGCYLVWKEHGFAHALYEKLSWIFIEVGAVLLYLSYNNYIPLLPVAGWIVFGIGVLLLIKGEGFTAIIEIPSVFVHIVSYARLMAVGLASVYIAVMVNLFTSFLWHKGVLFIPIAIIALLIGHLFNIALGVLSPSLHAIRLHYVEFFTKFYSGGGIEFAPFGKEKEKSII